MAIAVHLVAYLTSRGYTLGQTAFAAGGLGLPQVAGRATATVPSGRLSDHVVDGVIFVAQGASVALPLLSSGHDTSATVAVRQCRLRQHPTACSGSSSPAPGQLA